MAYDVNSDYTVSSLTALVDQGLVDVVIHSGDISYADGYMPHFDDFMNKVQPIATRVPYMVTAVSRSNKQHTCITYHAARCD